MKCLLCMLCIISMSLQASSELRTVRKTKKGLRITTVASQGHHIPRQKSADTKAWKHAMLAKDVQQLKKLRKKKHPTDTSLNRQNALLNIASRTANPDKRKQLFEAGLRSGLYTLDAALVVAQAMRRHAHNLATLATQTRSKLCASERKVTIKK